jgi:GT2 family glycosyltransferase
LKSLNGFREDFFLYQEDLELCIRVIKSGLRIVTVPAAGVDHVDPPAGPASDTVEYFRIRNLFATYLLHAPAGVLPAFLVRYGAIDLPRNAVRNPHRAWLMVKAWLSIVASTPQLMRDRDNRPLAPPVRNSYPATGI